MAETANQHPLYANIVVDARRDFAPSKTILDQMNLLADPRVEAYAEPNSKGEYDGVPYGITQSEIVDFKDCATFDPRFYQQDSPMGVISAAHILLIQAEAAARGWISASVDDLYKAGIAASFDEYQMKDKAEAYYNQPSVALSGNAQDKIEKIAMQRWIANFMHDGVEAWSDWRRLNVPALKPGTAAAVTHIPYRRRYYPNDYNTNVENYEAAIAAQGEDSFDTRVWWDVADND